MVGFEVDEKNEVNLNVPQELQMFNLQKLCRNNDYHSSLSAFKVNNTNIISLSTNCKTYQCLVCEKLFNQRSTYQNHIQLHGRNVDDPCLCNICGKSFAVPARLTRHYRTHTGEKPYQCEYCNKSFSVKENLSVHRRIHTKERPYKCDICQSAFEHSGKLHRHMRIHTGERPHKCSLCNKTFIQSGQLVIHMRTHTGEKPYICKSCGKGFTCSKQLKVHTRTHTGEKPYKCDICGKSFGYNHVLKLHQVAHYGEKFYKCTICQETFNSKKLMELHIKSHSDTHSISKQLDADQKITNVILSEYKNDLDDNKTLKQKSKKKKHTAKIVETRISETKHTSFNLSYYSIDKPYTEHDNQQSSKPLTNQSYLSGNTYTFMSQQSRNIATACKHSNDASPAKQTLTRHLLTNFNSNDSRIYEVEKDNFFSPSDNLRYNVGNVVEPFNKYQQINNELKEHVKTTTINNDLLSPSSYSNSMNLLIPNTRDHVSLPLRKRYRMIFELMETNDADVMPVKRCNSVIKFAKADNNNLIHN